MAQAAGAGRTGSPSTWPRRRPGLRYANLAIRGKLLSEVLDEQVPAAVAMGADLVSLAAGGNDLLRPRTDPDDLAVTFETAVAALRPPGRRSWCSPASTRRHFPCCG